MTASNRLSLPKVTPHQFDKSSCNIADDLIIKYVFTLKDINPEWLAKPFIFSDTPSLSYQVAYIIEHAVPLEVFEKFVRNYSAVFSDTVPNALIDTEYTIDLNIGITIQGTLIKLLTIVLDQSVDRHVRTCVEGRDLDEGLADKFVQLVRELWPSREIDVIKQLQSAIFDFQKNTIDEMETAALAALEELYLVVQENRYNELGIQIGIINFKYFLQERKQNLSDSDGLILDRRYPLLLCFLNYKAFALHRVDTETLPTEIQIMRRFRLIIAETIQACLPARMRQMIQIGFANLNLKPYMIEAPRTFFTSLDEFKGVNSKYKLGINFYYDASLRQNAYYHSLRTYYPTTPTQDLRIKYNALFYKPTRPLHDALNEFLLVLEIQPGNDLRVLAHSFIDSILNLFSARNSRNTSLFNFDEELLQLLTQYQRILELAASDMTDPTLINECGVLIAKAEKISAMGQKIKDLSIIGYIDAIVGVTLTFGSILLFPLVVSMASPGINVLLAVGYPIFTLACCMMGWNFFLDGVRAITNPIQKVIPIGKEAIKLADNVTSFFNRRESPENRIEIEASSGELSIRRLG